MPGSGAELGARLRARDPAAAPAALNLVESRTPAARAEVAALLREVSPGALGGEAPAHVVGVTGPPGAGKSTLLGELVRCWRSGGRTVAALAVDPSSRRSGGALLGGRAPVPYDPGAAGGLRAPRRPRPDPVRPRRRRRLHPLDGSGRPARRPRPGDACGSAGA